MFKYLGYFYTLYDWLYPRKTNQLFDDPAFILKLSLLFQPRVVSDFSFFYSYLHRLLCAMFFDNSFFGKLQKNKQYPTNAFICIHLFVQLQKSKTPYFSRLYFADIFLHSTLAFGVFKDKNKKLSSRNSHHNKGLVSNKSN